MVASNGEKAAQGQVYDWNIAGRNVTFYVADASDEIQRYHSWGKFYEAEELDLIKKHFPKNGIFWDIGANVGNHALYAAIFLEAKEVVVFEPSVAAIKILERNVKLNDLKDIVDTQYLGHALSDREGKGIIHEVVENNLGSARMAVTGSGPISLIRGDDLVGNRKVDFIKIDVEGMEPHVLAGIEKIIDTNRPRLFIEVEDRNFPVVHDWMMQRRYVSVDRYRRYNSSENFVYVPLET